MLTNSASKSAMIASLHFSPVFASHMLAYARLLVEGGYSVTFLLNERYRGFAEFDSFGATILPDELREWQKHNHPEVAIFANAAISNFACALRLRNAGTRTWYIFHEPNSVFNHLGEGWKDILNLLAAKWASIVMLLISTGVLVPSERALSLYMKYFQHYNRNVHLLHLLFDEEIESAQCFHDTRRRKYFSFLGGATKAHNIDLFIEFAKHAVREKCGFPLAIATRTDLSAFLNNDAEFADYVRQGKILVQHGRVLSAAEMDQKYLDSFCVWNLYKYSTQSGVLPRAFMAGTAVIATRMGSFPEFILPGINGEFVESAYDFDAIIQAARKISGSIQVYVAGCRYTFRKLFHYRAGRTSLAVILDSGFKADTLEPAAVSGDLPA
jgi:glycosyltransferase involved in cell wall biosynthesis